jgi:hypothetical protein
MLGTAQQAFGAEPDAQKAPKAADLRVAADRFDEGRAAFKASAFSEAAEHFEAADARAPSSSALTLAMRSHTEAGQYAKAASLAELVKVRYADNPDLVAQADAVISAHLATLGRLDIDCATRCELVIDQKLVHGHAMNVWHVYLEPGNHEVVANFVGDREAVAQTSVLAGEPTALSLDAPPSSSEDGTKPVTLAQPLGSGAPPASASKPNHGLPPTVFWIELGATAVVGGVTIWSGIDTQTNPGPAAVHDACKGQTSSCPLYQKGQAKQLRTNLLIGGTALLAVATAVTGIFATDFSRSSKTPQRGAPNWSLRPMASIGLGQETLFGAEGRF